MFSNAGIASIVQVFLILIACEGIHGLALEAGGSSKSTSSYSTTKISSSISSSTAALSASPSFASTSSTSTTFKIPTTTENTVSGTITPAPVYTAYTYTGAWGNQSIVLNTCSFTANQGNIEWEPCSVQVGSIKLSYFPEASGNVTYPKTHYVPEWDITMTSPSIYMLLNTVTGYNDCGALGPTFKNKVISMLITDVSTLPPYADSTTRDRISTQERQLTLSDLLDCPSYSTHPSGASTNDHPVSDTYNRCNPFIKMPEEASAIGYPFWRHCAPVSYRMGVWDPPGAVPTVTGLFQSTTDAPGALPAQTGLFQSTDTPSTSTADPASTIKSMPASTAVVDATSTLPVEVVATSAQPDPASVSPVVVMDLVSTATPIQAIVVSTTQASAPEPSPSSVIVVIGTNTISLAPNSSGIVLPGGSTASVGQVITLTDASSNAVVVSVATSGIYVVSGSGALSTYYSNPTIPVPAGGAVLTSKTAIATIGGQVASAAPGASVVQIGTQVLTAGGAEVTLSGGNVATLGPGGSLLVKYPSGTTSIFVVPSAAPLNNDLAGATYLSGAGSSAIVVGTQIASIGGPAVTLSNHDVVSLGSSGLNVQMPGGTISTLIPSANLGLLIASMVGVTSATTSAVSSSTSSSLASRTTAAGLRSSSSILAHSGSTTAGLPKSLVSSKSASASSSKKSGTAGPLSSHAASSRLSSSSRSSSLTSSKKLLSSSGSSNSTTSSSTTLMGSITSSGGSGVTVAIATQPAATNIAVTTFTGAGLRQEVNLGAWGLLMLAVGLPAVL